MSLSIENDAPKQPRPTHEAHPARPALTPERYAAGLLIATLKQLVKADAVTIRSARRGTRALQRAGAPEAARAQSGLAALRLEARARHLIHGMARGRPLARMEPGREEVDWRLERQLAATWQDVRESVRRIAGLEPALPDLLRPHLPRGTE